MKILKTSLGFLVAGCVVVLTGCPTKNNPEAAGLDCDPTTHICVGTLAITSPGPVSHTNGPITIQVTAMPVNNPPSEVEIRKDGATLASVGPPFSYSWDTRNEPEGSHSIDAIANVGSAKVMANPVIIWVDRTPPSISMRTPAQNATNIALSDPIRIVFSEALDPSSVSNAAVSLSSGGTTLSTTAKLESDGVTLDVTLGDHSTLSFPATITATVNPAIKDLAGNAVGAIPSWSWTAPLWVKMPSLAARLSFVALDSTGRASVAYMTDSATTTKLSVARYAAGAVWDFGPGSPTTDSVTYAGIASESDGTPVVAWAADHIRSASWNGTTWTRVGGDIDAGLPTAVSFGLLSLTLNPSDEPVVGWTAYNPQPLAPNGYIAAWSGTSWQTIPPGMAAPANSPVVHFDSLGNPVALFGGYVGSTTSIQKYANGSWTSIDQENGLLDLAVDSMGRPVTLFEDMESSLEVIHVRVLTSTGWGDLVPSIPTGGSLDVGGQLLLDAAGHPVVLWAQTDTNSRRRLHVERFNGATWDTTFGVLTGVASNNGSVNAENMAIDSLGTPTVTWSENDTTTNVVSVYTWKSNY